MKVNVNLRSLSGGRIRITVKSKGPDISTGGAVTYGERSEVIRVLEAFGYSQEVISKGLNNLGGIARGELIHLPEAEVDPAVLRENGFLSV